MLECGEKIQMEVSRMMMKVSRDGGIGDLKI